MNDSFSTTETTGYFSRLGKSLGGIIVGPILILGCVALLWWNEGRSVHTATALNEGQKEVITVQSESVSPANDKKLIYLTGLATTEETLKDSKFNLGKNGLVLNRKTEIFVWKEKVESHKKKNLGGSETTTKTYSYEKVWSDRLIDSKKFERQDGHNNPSSMRIPSEKFVGKNVSLGAFKVDKSLVEKIDGERQFDLKEEDLENAGDFDDISLRDGGFYLGKNPNNPEIGDITVKYFLLEPTDISVVAGQFGSVLNTFNASNGEPIALVQAGSHSAEALFETARSENSMLTWILRVFGIIFCVVGFAAIMKPLSVLADILPFAGTLVGYGTIFVAGILGLSVSVLTIAIAWIFYRPVLGISLLLVTGGAVYYFWQKKKASVANAPRAAGQRTKVPA